MQYNMVSRLAEYVFLTIFYFGYLSIFAVAAVGIYSFVSDRFATKRSTARLQLA
jgi:hypothetical protein